MEIVELKVSEVEKAVEALKQCLSKTEENRQLRSLIKEDKVALQFSVKKMCIEKRRAMKVVLPHPPERETCLFVKDVDKRSREFANTTCAYQDILKENGIENVKVIPLKDLKINYTNYESKIKLTNAFEVFLADSRIIRLLPSFLSSAFQKRNRCLLQVRLDSKDLKGEIEKVRNSTQCVLHGRGSSSQIVIGHIDQTSAQLAENIVACFEKIQKEITGGPKNVRNAQIKCGDSLSVPLYVSFDSRNEVQLPKPEAEDKEIEAEEVATVLEGKLLIRKGEIGIVSNTEATGKPEIKKLRATKRKGDKYKMLASKKFKKGGKC